MDNLVKEVVYQFAKDIQKIFGEKLSKLVVYGSYARGDYTKNSDIDIMILVKIPEQEIHRYMNVVLDCAFDYLMDYGVDISPVIKNEEHFNYWVEDLPYYRNVRDEGVVVHS
ncbi:DNA polymerase, beta-like region [Lachnospiraceae bacterium TWA4]|nr:DNA polymerase, beta-like region [Lachnospiraceae bacterium TWA4]